MIALVKHILLSQNLHDSDNNLVSDEDTMDSASVSSQRLLPPSINSARTQRKSYDNFVRAHSSMGHESGFQSTGSLTSLPCGSMGGSMYETPISFLTGSYVDNVGGLGHAPSDSMVSLTSGISSFRLPSSNSPMIGISSRRHSLNKINDNMSGSRISLGGKLTNCSHHVSNLI